MILSSSRKQRNLKEAGRILKTASMLALPCQFIGAYSVFLKFEFIGKIIHLYYF
jgi:hypothetical protein